MTGTTNTSFAVGRPEAALRLPGIHPNTIIEHIPGATLLLECEEITIERAMRLSAETGATVQFWLNIQENFNHSSGL